MPEVKLKIGDKEIFVNVTPIYVEICTTIPQELFKFYCNGKEYIVRINNNKKLQMTA